MKITGYSAAAICEYFDVKYDARTDISYNEFDIDDPRSAGHEHSTLTVRGYREGDGDIAIHVIQYYGGDRTLLVTNFADEQEILEIGNGGTMRSLRDIVGRDENGPLFGPEREEAFENGHLLRERAQKIMTKAYHTLIACALDEVCGFISPIHTSRPAGYPRLDRKSELRS